MKQSLEKSEHESHPMWVRGLKHSGHERRKDNAQSHPMWVRGLKLGRYQVFGWVLGRILCGCVD